MSRQSVRSLAHRPLAAIEQLHRDDDLWRLAANSLTAQIAVLDEQGIIIAVNEAWQRGSDSAGNGHDYVGANYIAGHEAAGDLASRRIADGLKAVASGRLQKFEYEYPSHSDGGDRWFLMRVTRAGPGSSARIVVSHQDVTEQRLSQSRERWQSLLLDEVNVAVHAVDENRIVQSWNAAAEQLYGWTAEEALGRSADELIISSETRADAAAAKLIAEGQWEGDLVLARRDGSTFPAHVRSRIVRDFEDDKPLIVAVTMDISLRKRHERELRLARDQLRAVTSSVGEGMFTVDNSGLVTYTNPVAEAQLGWTAAELHGRDLHQLTHNRRPDGSAFPVDECQIMLACRERTIVEVDDDIFIRADGTELEVAYTAAPISTDDEIHGCVVVFRDVSDRNAERRRVQHEVGKLASIKRIREALDLGRFVLFAQPIVHLGSGNVVQQELLIRMQDPDREGLVMPPSAFLPVAEEFGLIGEIDRWVIDQAAGLAAAGHPVELNVSGVSIGDPRLLNHINDAIERSGADPGKLVFEITETTLLANELVGHRFVDRLHELGCGVALDDFGTGYGGFTYLKQLPVDIIKIDIEFVRDLTVSGASQNVVESIVNLARRFEVLTVAEGVEDQETLDMLRDLGVDRAQGYCLGRPAPIQTPSSQVSEGLRA